MNQKTITVEKFTDGEYSFSIPKDDNSGLRPIFTYDYDEVEALIRKHYGDNVKINVIELYDY